MNDKPAPLDPVEERTITLTNAQIGNLLQCCDLMRRHCALEQVRDVLDLIDVLAKAVPKD